MTARRPRPRPRSRRGLRDFVRLNPEYAAAADRDGLAQFHPNPLPRELGTRAGLALVDENRGSAQQRAAAVAERATQAQRRAAFRETLLAGWFAALNPAFGVRPSRTDADQQRLAHGRERVLALGSRVHLAEARENSGNPELAAALVRARARLADRLARQQPPPARQAAERARPGMER